MYESRISFQQMYKESIKLSLLESHLGDYSKEAMMSPSAKYMGKISLNQNLNSNYNLFN